MVSSERGIRRIVTAGLLLAITLLMTLVPNIGFISVPTPAGSATIAHIPTIIGGILEGPLVGIIVGLGLGFGSIMSPQVPVKDPLVVLLPRLFIGITAAAAFFALRRANRITLNVMLAVLLVFALIFSYIISQRTLWLGIVVGVVVLGLTVAAYFWMRTEDTYVISLAIAGIVGSLTNTVLVLTMAVVRQILTPDVALFIALTQGIPEAVVSAVVVVAIVAALRQVGRRRGSRLSSELKR